VSSRSISTQIKLFIEYFAKSDKGLKSVEFSRLLSEIDGISDIESIAENMQLDISVVAKLLVHLWITNHINFRIPIYNWDIFERTHKSNDYLLDGSESQRELLEFYGGGKIVSLLSRFDGRSPISEIHKKMNINELRFMRYVYDLFDMGLIKKSEKYPVMRHIGQEIVPLLVIQGLQQKDLKIIEELENRFDGTHSITSVALKMDESPKRIKQILDKIPEYVQYNSI
jgi:predicted DNA-binding transcriptional regulator